MNELVIEAIRRNYWLSGAAEFEDGDPFSAMENGEMLESITEVGSVEELVETLMNYAGTFRYRNLYFAKHPHYGCFVFVAKRGEVREFEHLSCIDRARLHRAILKMVEADKASRDVKEFLELYFPSHRTARGGGRHA